MQYEQSIKESNVIFRTERRNFMAEEKNVILVEVLQGTQVVSGG